MAIKRKEKRRLLQTAALLMRANERVFMGFGQNTEEMMIDALSQSQETALWLGTELENVGKADLVPLLEVYCEDLYEMSQNLHSKKQMAKLYKKIKKELKLLYDHIENEIETDRLCFVFLPYKVSMWDSMETVWKAADKDPDCDAYVVPIPYFDKDQDGNLAVEHYEGDQYPSDVPITDYRTFRLEDKKPDAVFIHNPYDQNNRLTSVHPDFYSSRLKMLWSSFFVTLVAKKIVLINLCCRPCFIWGSITIITVWTNMIIINVCKFFYLLIECFLCCKLIQICAFILQGIEVTLHRCIVVRISCFAHALCHIYRFAEFGKCFGRIL